MPKTTTLLLILIAGCSFDSTALDARRCSTEDQCADFGPGYACRQGYCVAQGESCASDGDCAASLGPCLREACMRGYCAPLPETAGTRCPSSHACAEAVCDGAGQCVSTPRDERCSNGLPCDGVERCIPDLAADASGCVSGEAPEADDDIDCTVGRCDDRLGGVVQDASACQCQVPGEPCDDGSAPTCFVSRCGPDYTCALAAEPEGTPCEDGVGCTTDGRCSASQTCVSTPDHSRCGDAKFCNGEELCAPGAPDAGQDGCRPGAPLDLSDGIDCTADYCDEATDSVLHDPAECGCEQDADCETECTQGMCINLLCVVQPLPDGTQCDDEVDCTVADACRDGVCRGDADHGRCQNTLYCDGAELCAPDAHRPSDGCVAGTPPAELYEGRECEVISCDEADGTVVVDDSECCDPAAEGPSGHATCSDNIDNDCDGLLDARDPDCGFVPTQLSGLRLWLDASDDDNLRVTGMDDVNEWVDLSGNGNNAYQSGRQRPRLESVDGQNRVRLDGSRYLIVSNESQFDFRTGLTAIVVFSVSRFDSDWQALLTKGDDSWRVHRQGNSDEIAFGYSRFFGGNDIHGGDPTGGGLHQVMARWDDGEADLWLDAVAVDDESHLDGNLERNDDPVMVGNNADRTERGWKGDVTEVIVYDRPLNGNERALVFAYLRAKWSLP